MKQKNRKTDEGRTKVPAYIVTFSDMVTLLLTFFVMLLSLASVQDPELFNLGRGSFFKSIKGLGLGMLQGRKDQPHFGSYKMKYYVSNPDGSVETRTIDARQEELRRIFEKISQSMTTMPSQITANKTFFSVTDIRFSPGDATLDESAKKFLKEFCVRLQSTAESPDTLQNRKMETLYVLGLADKSADGAAEKEQWLLSAQRAHAVADFLRAAFNPHVQQDVAEQNKNNVWQVYWWGAGPGGDWVRQDSPIYEQSQILIAVLENT